MKFLSIYEYETIKVNQLDNYHYERIHDAFVDYFSKACGAQMGIMMGEKVFKMFEEKTLQELSCNSYIDVLSLVKILG